MNVNERLPRLGDVDQGVAGRRHLAHPSADEEQDVGIADARRRVRVDANSDVAGVVRMVMVEQRLPTERATDGQVEPLNETLHSGDGRLASSANRRG